MSRSETHGNAQKRIESVNIQSTDSRRKAHLALSLCHQPPEARQNKARSFDTFSPSPCHLWGHWLHRRRLASRAAKPWKRNSCASPIGARLMSQLRTTRFATIRAEIHRARNIPRVQSGTGAPAARCSALQFKTMARIVCKLSVKKALVLRLRSSSPNFALTPAGT